MGSEVTKVKLVVGLVGGRFSIQTDDGSLTVIFLPAMPFKKAFSVRR
jgi:hypothetical protein